MKLADIKVGDKLGFQELAALVASLPPTGANEGDAPHGLGAAVLWAVVIVCAAGVWFDRWRRG